MKNNITKQDQEMLEEFEKKYRGVFKEVSGKGYLTKGGDLTNIYKENCFYELESFLLKYTARVREETIREYEKYIEKLPKHCFGCDGKCYGIHKKEYRHKELQILTKGSDSPEEKI